MKRIKSPRPIFDENEIEYHTRFDWVDFLMLTAIACAITWGLMEIIGPDNIIVWVANMIST